MSNDIANLRKLLSQDLTQVLIRVGLIAALVVLCVQVFAPFLLLMIWALILAVALYPLHRKALRLTGGRNGRAATAIVLCGMLVIGAPTVMLGSSFAAHVQSVYAALESNTVILEKPAPSVAEWPLIGKRVHAAWTQASENLPGFLDDHREEIKKYSRKALGVAASTAGSVLIFLAALLVAGIVMAYGESGNAAMSRVFGALTGRGAGPQLQKLSTATVRSVATGVVGVAFIQALLLGLGFIAAGVPGAGLLAALVMLLGIAQLPAALISLPVIGYLWWAGDASTTMNIVYTIYLVIAGLADNVLKPMLLGRGVDAPMPVVLLGALGGMASNGIVGLFSGAVLLSVGYVIFMSWVDSTNQEPGADTAADTAEASVDR